MCLVRFYYVSCVSTRKIVLNFVNAGKNPRRKLFNTTGTVLDIRLEGPLVCSIHRNIPQK